MKVTMTQNSLAPVTIGVLGLGSFGPAFGKRH